MTGRDPSVVVVGAGVGGLACAIDLAARGARVRVLERAAGPGGKARTLEVDGVEFDGGPTVLTMPWVFDELFDAAGASFRAEVGLERAPLVARHAWRDGPSLDLYADRQRSADAIGEAFGAREARAYLDFCADGRRMYELSEAAFLRAQRPTLAGIARQFGAAGLGALARLDVHRTMWRALEQRFAAPRLRQLFGRYATYCGSSPFEAPGTLNLVAHVEAEGVYRARGGMRALVAALDRLARSLGVELLYGHGVERVLVERGRAAGVVARGADHAADAVVFNGDVSALGAGLLGAPAARAATVTPPEARSLSAVTWALRAKATGFPLAHHNVFFADDYAAEFDAILRRRQVPDEPTVYVCAQDRGGDDAPPAAGERLLVLVNAPATGDAPERWNEPEKERCTNATLTLLRKAGLTLETSASAQTTPADYHRLFPATGGALYGPRSKGPLAALSRQAAASKVPGLYLAGGSVHPGPGVPMAALSGRLAAAQVLQDLASTGRSRPAAITGTTSTG
ncbi:MAG: phytoene desaturase family protein [Polyangiaceae bacterium]|nr:phytoene desaturase family protein [Polyangiaceae bacterium]